MSYESQVRTVESMPEPDRTYLRTFMRHKALESLSNETIANYLARIVVFTKWYQYKDLKQITRDDIENYIIYRKGIVSPETVNSDLIVGRMFFSELLDKPTADMLYDGIRIKVNHFSPVRDEELLTDEEIKRMLSAAHTERDRALIAVLYASGCRCGEILGLKLKDVMFSQYGVSLHVNGKTGERDVDLFVGVAELKSWYNVHPFRDDPNSLLWLSNTGGSINHSCLYAMLRRIARRAGIPEGKRIHPHAFRHKRATDCAQFMTTADMKEMFGWTKGSEMPTIYVHSSRQRVRDKLMANAGIEIPEQRKSSALVGKQCKVCGCINSSTATICMACASPLDEGLSRADNEYQEYLREHAAELLVWKAEKDKEKKNE